MGEIVRSIPVWIYMLVVLALAPAGAALGTSHGELCAVAPFALIVIATCASGLSGHRMTAMATAGLAACAVCVIAYARMQGTPSTPELLLPLIEAFALIAVAGMSVGIVQNLQQRIADLDDQNTYYVRELYRRDRQHEELESRIADVHDVPAASTLTSPRSSENDQRQVVDFAMLLLTLQDVAQRISANVDMDTLIPTVINTAKRSLKCKSCRLYFWDAPRRKLTDKTPGQYRQPPGYVPNPNTGMAKWVVQNRQILTRSGVQKDYTLTHLLDEDPHMPDAIAPLTVGGELLGLLIVEDVAEESVSFVRLLYILSHNCALGLKNAQLFKRIEHLARHDGLTGLMNHASFQEELERLIAEPPEPDGGLAVIMSDIDHFKRFNDTYGHQAGDHVLREVARLWQAVMPDSAILARYGGEEFICALPRENLLRAQQLAGLMRQEVEMRTLDFEGQQLSVTASFGVAELGPTVNSAVDLVRTADEALYQAKAQGRNRVVIAPSRTDSADSENLMSPSV